MLVDTWHDQSCGCTWSERGWWVIALRCRNPHHQELVSAAHREQLRSNHRHYGPVADEMLRGVVPTAYDAQRKR